MAEDVKSSQGGPRVEIHGRNFRGGLTIAILALLLLVSTFAISAPTIPRILSIVVALVGVGVAAGLVPVRGPQDFYGGLVLVLLAIFALVASADLPGQRGFAFGPGTAPRLFSGILAALGAVVTLVGTFVEGPEIEKYKIHGPALVVISIFLFAALIRPFGLVPATYLAFMLSIMGSTEMRWIETNAADFSAHSGEHWPVRVIAGLDNYGLVTRRYQSHNAIAERFGRAGGYEHLCRGIELQPMTKFQPVFRISG